MCISLLETSENDLVCHSQLLFDHFDSDGQHQSPDLLFLRGHLALLMGLFLLQLKACEKGISSDESAFYDILICLPGTSSRRKLDALINNVDTFSQLYSSVTGSVTRQADAEIGEEFRDKDNQTIAKHVANNGPHSSQSDVVADVVMSLRTLRDEV